MADCIFCAIAAGDVPARIVHSDEDVIAFEDINPGAPAHLLVIPRQHLPDVRDLSGAMLEKLFGVARSVAAAKGVEESGYRLVFNVGPDAGQSVFHAHLHLLGGRRLSWPPG
jgi:histidine triad (HIT) family protein